LKNYVQRAYILADTVIDDGGQPEVASLNADEDDVITVRIGMPLHEIEERVTMATLTRCGNVKKRAAEILGISLKTLYNRLESYAQRERSDVESRDTETV
ncbi:MAG: helix-turn-helix domain-containing protein, partial [Burkholderiaceae bacterium]